MDRLLIMARGDSPVSCLIYLIVAVYYLPLIFILAVEVLLFSLLMLAVAAPDALCFGQIGTRRLTEWYWCNNAISTDRAMGYGMLAGPTGRALKNLVPLIQQGPVALSIAFLLPVGILAPFWVLFLMMDFLISGLIVMPMVLVSLVCLLVTCPCLWLKAVSDFHISFVNKIVRFINLYWRMNIVERRADGSVVQTRNSSSKLSATAMTATKSPRSSIELATMGAISLRLEMFAC